MQGHGPLAGVRVIDTSERSVSAAVVCMVLTQLGAEVIRAEGPDGDPIRALRASEVWLAGTRSVAISDGEIADGSWARLLASADVVIATAHPQTSLPAGLLDGVSKAQVQCVLTDYPRAAGDRGAPGTRPVYGELVEAELGFTGEMQKLYAEVAPGGDPGRPVFLGWPHAAYGAAWLMLLGILAALIKRERGGGGQLVTTSLYDGLAILSSNLWMHGQNIPTPGMNSAVPKLDDVNRFIFGLYRTKDGWLFIHTGPRGSFNRLMALIGRPELVRESTTSSLYGDAMQPEEARRLRAELIALMATRTTEEWMQVLPTSGVAVMPALEPGEVLKLKQARANEMSFDNGGRLQVGRTAKYARTPTELGGQRPAVGADGALLKQANIPPSVPADGPAAGAVDAPPLDGITVLDFGAFIAGPYANRVLADLGARVIKVEEPAGDPMRIPFSVFGVCNRSKEDIAINLKSAEGLAAARELVKRADVLNHNMRNGVMERLGLDYESVRALNPSLVYAHSSGYGNAGPWTTTPAFEPLHSALSGLLHRASGSGNRPQMYMSHMDFGGGLTGATAVLAGLFERMRSGEGQYVEAPQLASGILAMSDVFIEAGRTIESFGVDAEGRGHAPTNALYPTADGHVVIACGSEAEWQALGRVLGLDDGPAYAAARQQSVADNPLYRRISDALGSWSSAEALRRLTAAGVPAAIPDKAAFSAERRADKEALGIFVSGTHPVHGLVHEIGRVIRFSGGAGERHRPAPEIGQDTRDILGEIGLGNRADALEAQGAVKAYPVRAAAE